DTFARLKARLPDTGRVQPRRMASWLSDIAFCQGCGRKLYVHNRKRARGTDRSFRCNGRVDALDPCTATATINVGRLEAYIEDLFLSYGGHFPEMIREEHLDAPDAALELQDIEHATQDVLRAFRADGADYVTLSARLETLKARKRHLESLPATVRIIERPTGRTLADVWRDLDGDLAARRDHVRQVVQRIYVGRVGAENWHRPLDGERVHIVWNPDREIDPYGEGLVAAPVPSTGRGV
ncbi:MAG: hypothetical protein K0S65_782, partial [Labilithrix sp.]|nr:hypothetical protein [Labilithrix sp.]